jgi:hypothetical protein
MPQIDFALNSIAVLNHSALGAGEDVPRIGLSAIGDWCFVISRCQAIRVYSVGSFLISAIS